MNLTSTGTQDWAVWGYAASGTSTSLTRDNGKVGGSDISALTDITHGDALRGLGQFGTYGEATFDWTNGSPVISATGATTGLQHNSSLAGLGEGFSFTVPADPTLHRVVLYTTTNGSIATFTATLSDNSAPQLVQVLDASSARNEGAIFTVDYAAASAGQTLTISATVTSTTDSGGNVAVQAVSLTAVPEPASIGLIAVSALLASRNRRR